MDSGDEEQESKEHGSDLRQSERVQGDPDGGESLTDDKIEDVIRRIPNGEDVYMTMHGRKPKRSGKLNSFGVSDGCTIQVTSRMRGGGRRKDKKSKVEKKINKDENGQKDQRVELGSKRQVPRNGAEPEGRGDSDFGRK